VCIHVTFADNSQLCLVQSRKPCLRATEPQGDVRELMVTMSHAPAKHFSGTLQQYGRHLRTRREVFHLVWIILLHGQF
jgi:hypothetical protein